MEKFPGDTGSLENIGNNGEEPLRDDHTSDRNYDFFNSAKAKHYLQKRKTGMIRILKRTDLGNGNIRILRKRDVPWGMRNNYIRIFGKTHQLAK